VRFVALDADGIVRRVGVLRRRRVVVCRNAVWLAEYSCDFGAPGLGSQALLDRLASWPAH
jgi:hypothetical protein